jgi:hypothetical protein
VSEAVIYPVHINNRADGRDADGLVLLYSITSRSSYECVGTIEQRVKRGPAVFVLASTKVEKA